MNKILPYFFLISFLFSTLNTCLNNFYNYNKNILNNHFICLKAFLNDDKNDSLLIFIEKDTRYKIEFNDKIILANRDRMIDYSSKTNQLFIEKPDSILNNFLFSIADSLFLDKITKNKYINFEDIKIYYNDSCNKIDSLILENSGKIIRLNDIIIDTVNINYPDSFFSLGIDESKVFKYDFR